MDFFKILGSVKNKKVNTSLKDKKIISKIKKHWEKYRHNCCAYGENPHDLNFYLKKYQTISDSDLIKSKKNKKRFNKKEKRGGSTIIGDK